MGSDPPLGADPPDVCGVLHPPAGLGGPRLLASPELPPRRPRPSGLWGFAKSSLPGNFRDLPPPAALWWRIQALRRSWTERRDSWVLLTNFIGAEPIPVRSPRFFQNKAHSKLSFSESRRFSLWDVPFSFWRSLTLGQPKY